MVIIDKSGSRLVLPDTMTLSGEYAARHTILLHIKEQIELWEQVPEAEMEVVITIRETERHRA